MTNLPDHDSSGQPVPTSSTCDRRTFAKLVGTGLATAAAGGAGGAFAATTGRSYDPHTFTGPALEAETGGPIYHLPRDHAMHGGVWYRGAEYQETNYFTGFFTDRNTGRPYSVFFSWATYGWVDALERPVWVALFSMTDIERKKFVQCVQPMMGPLGATGSGPGVGKDEFFAEYKLGEDEGGNSGLFSYAAKEESWRWMANVVKPTDGLPNQTPFFMDVRSNVMKPGYQCPVPYGFTQEGLGTDVTNNLANPFTGAALSWYIIAPCHQARMTLRCDDMDLDLEGQFYHEHQWGRIRIPGMEQARYFWGWARMDNGDILNWRTYRDVETGDFRPEDPANRFNVVRPDGSVQYFMGPAFTYEPTRSWKSPETGVDYPIHGKMVTPMGVFHTDPVVEVAEAQLFNGGMWEGAMRLRADGPDGPVVGHGFIEFMWAPFDSALGKDIPYDPSITARRDANLPDAPDFAPYMTW
jgi:hypothetical protein